MVGSEDGVVVSGEKKGVVGGGEEEGEVEGGEEEGEEGSGEKEGEVEGGEEFVEWKLSTEPLEQLLKLQEGRFGFVVVGVVGDIVVVVVGVVVGDVGDVVVVGVMGKFRCLRLAGAFKRRAVIGWEVIS